MRAREERRGVAGEPRPSCRPLHLSTASPQVVYSISLWAESCRPRGVPPWPAPTFLAPDRRPLAFPRLETFVCLMWQITSRFISNEDCLVIRSDRYPFVSACSRPRLRHSFPRAPIELAKIILIFPSVRPCVSLAGHPKGRLRAIFPGG